jgi:drug/metabolite transporter (DMT)-like permease
MRGKWRQGQAMIRSRATAIGFSAILMWSLLALFTIGSAPVPPLAVERDLFRDRRADRAGLDRGQGFGVLRGVSWKVYAFGTLGLFGYHVLYFTAFRLSPTAETGLIAYLWPLFIVLLLRPLPGERLRAQHVGGALVAFAGAAVIVLGREGAARRGSAAGHGAGLPVRADLGGLFDPVAAIGRRADRERHGLSALRRRCCR